MKEGGARREVEGVEKRDVEDGGDDEVEGVGLENPICDRSEPKAAYMGGSRGRHQLPTFLRVLYESENTIMIGAAPRLRWD